MNMLMQPTNTTESTNLPYFCMGELNLSIMQKVSEIITNPKYEPFKKKTKKNAQTYTQYYVCNTPHTNHAFYYLQAINSISPILLKQTTFQISQSVMAVQEAYANLGYNSDGPINPNLLHNQHYVETILPAVVSFSNELKRHSTTRVAIADRDKRVALINEIKKANVPVMKKLFKTHQRFNLNIFTYVFNVKECTFLKDKIALEESLIQQMTNTINKFLEQHQSEILALFFCVQPDLSDNYVLNAYCATERECPPLSMKDCITLRNDSYLIIAPNSNITLKIQEIDYKMDIQGVDGTNEKTWKSIFGQQVEKYKYVYYESEFVSPKFIYIGC